MMRRVLLLAATCVVACTGKLEVLDAADAGAPDDAAAPDLPRPPASTSPTALTLSAIAPPTCRPIFAESHGCLTTSYPSRLLAVGLDTGRLCAFAELAPTTGGAPEGSLGLGVLGDALYTCAQKLSVRKLPGGPAKTLGVPCLWVGSFEGGLVVASGEPGKATLDLFASNDAVTAGKSTRVEGLTMQASRFAVQGDRVYAAWHSTSRVEVALAKTRAPLPPLTLEGHDDWVFGLAVPAADTLAVLAPARVGESLRLFDASSGDKKRFLRPEPVGDAKVTGDLAGLACW